MNIMEAKNFKHPDETRELPKTKIAVTHFNDVTIMQATFLPGWKWSQCVKPTVGTDSCQVPHINVILSGRLHILLDDGTEKEFGQGDVISVPPGHDAWVVGDEPCVLLDIIGGKTYGKK